MCDWNMVWLQQRAPHQHPTLPARPPLGFYPPVSARATPRDYPPHAPPPGWGTHPTGASTIPALPPAPVSPGGTCTSLPALPLSPSMKKRVEVVARHTESSRAKRESPWMKRMRIPNYMQAGAYSWDKMQLFVDVKTCLWSGYGGRRELTKLGSTKQP